MKRLLALLALLPLFVVVASAQSVEPLRFRGVSIGMSRAEVRATGDTLETFADTAFGASAVITYRFADDRLRYIVIDYSRGTVATDDAVTTALAEFDSVHARVALQMGYPGGKAGRLNPGCSGASLAERIANRCESEAYLWTPDRIPTADVLQSIDAFGGTIVHRILFDPLGPSGVELVALPTALDLR